MSHRWIAVALFAAVVVTGCGAGPPLPPAAEPARAPVPTVAPAGRTVPVGAFPEGVVVDPRTRIVAVGVRDPFALTLLDATTGAVLRKVPLELSTSLPERLRHLRLAGPGGPVLVPDAGATRLLRVALPGGEVISQVVTGVVPREVATAANGTEFLANGDWHNLVAVRGDQTEHRFFEVVNPAGLVAVGDLVESPTIPAGTGCG